MPETGIRAVFAASVTRERKALGWSQRALAEKAGLSNAAVCDMESAKAGPSLETAALIAGALGVPLPVLLTREEASHG
jgi:transcriptional regulator with XRE-family HTH domain